MIVVITGGTIGEALHGFTGLYDLQLKSALGVTGPSCNIDNMIKREVLAHAVTPLNSQVAIPCP